MRKRWFLILLFSIILLASFLRFYRFPERWGMGSDDMRDVMIAQIAIERRELPLTGSFSSAGPFVFGPLFYWFIMASYLLFPYWLTTPWVMMGLVSIVTVGIFALTGYHLGGRKFSLILALLAATAPQLAFRGLTLGQHSFVSICSILLLYFFLLLAKTHRAIFAFWMGIALGIGISMHYQAINLLIVPPLIFFIPSLSWRTRFRMFFLLMIGLLIPSFPLLWWDSKQEFANIRNLLDYLLIGQHRLYVPNSWKLFLFNYLPTYWGFVTGGYLPLALFTSIAAGVTFLWYFFRSGLRRPLSLLGIAFGFLLFLNRYYKGERSEGYLIYFSPFIILFTAWTIYTLLSSRRILSILGWILLVTIVIGNLARTVPTIHTVNNEAKELREVIQNLTTIYPIQTFSIYDYRWMSSSKSYPLSALLAREKKIEKKGMAIGMYCLPYPLPYTTVVRWGNCQIFDLSKETNLEADPYWSKANPDEIYDDLITRWRNEKLTSTFHLW